MSLVYAKKVMISECVSCVPRVFLHASVVYVACGIKILDVLPYRPGDKKQLKAHDVTG
jgi:hypothetical protein